MKILLFGKYGQVGWELNRSLQPLGQVIALGRKQADFFKPDSLRDIVKAHRPDVIVNAVAYTAVDAAEDDEAAASLVNEASVRVLAEEAKKSGSLLVHFSTDYVFDGAGQRPYLETDEPSPVNAYGRTKLAGEQVIQQSCCKYLIFRTSWVYASRGKNFMLTMLRLAGEREQLKIVGDQIGSPTSARFIADVTATCLVRAIDRMKSATFESGLYNLTTGGATSWHGFAEQIIENQKRHSGESVIVKNVESIPSSDYPTPARRPLYSCLDTTKIKEDYDIRIPDWQDSLAICQEELL